MEYVKLDVAITCMSIFSYRMDSHTNKLAELKQVFTKDMIHKMKPY